AAIKTILENEGVNIRLDAECVSVAARGQHVAVHVDCTHGAPDILGSQVLLAVGRRPNTDDLGLERAGVATDAKGYIVVDDQLRTRVPGMGAWADDRGGAASTPPPNTDNETAAATLPNKEPPRATNRTPPSALSPAPPLGRAGMTEAQVRASGRPALIG